MHILSQIIRNRGDKVQDEPKQTIPEEEIVAKYTIKDSVFLTCLGLKNICCNYTSHSTRRIKQLQRMN